MPCGPAPPRRLRDSGPRDFVMQHAANSETNPRAGCPANGSSEQHVRWCVPVREHSPARHTAATPVSPRDRTFAPDDDSEPHIAPGNAPPVRECLRDAPADWARESQLYSGGKANLHETDLPRMPPEDRRW